MTLTRTQKRWAVGGGVGAAAIALGYGILHWRHKPSAHGEHEHRGHEEHGDREEHKEHKHHDDNERGEYGERGHEKHKHKHAHAGAVIGQRPQQRLELRQSRTSAEEGPGAPIWRLNDRINDFVFRLGQRMAGSSELWAKLHPVWEAEVLPFVGEWEVFWRDSTKWSWSEFDRWATHWNALSARVETMLPKEHARGA